MIDDCDGIVCRGPVDPSWLVAGDCCYCLHFPEGIKGQGQHGWLYDQRFRYAAFMSVDRYGSLAVRILCPWAFPLARICTGRIARILRILLFTFRNLESYIDSLYDDVSNEQLPHNGMTSRGLEGLTDSLCKDIALFHLLYSEVMGVDMSNGMTINSMLGRDINTSIDSVSGQVMLNNHSLVTEMDEELENGVLHVINHVLTRSNNLIAGEMEKHPQFSIFLQGLVMTGLVDSLSQLERKGIIMPKKYTGKGNSKMYTPDVCKVGYTIFAETDEVLKQNGINNVEDLFSYAKNVYENSASPEGWYDYYRNNNIAVSTGKDYQNPANVLNMFLRYHILRYSIPYNKMFYTYAASSKALIYEYLETMLPYTLMKVTRHSGKYLINRWVANSTLTDRVAEMASTSIATVLQEGIAIGKDNIQALNGYIHPIDGMLVYDVNVPKGVLNERMRFDDLSLLPEMMTNGLRCKNPSEVKAIVGGVYDTFAGAGNMRMPENYNSNIVVYNGDNTEVYYLGGQDCGWANYQGDEILCMGAYDFAFRLPPVPDGVWCSSIWAAIHPSRRCVPSTSRWTCVTCRAIRRPSLAVSLPTHPTW